MEKKLKTEILGQLAKSRGHLEYSFKKVSKFELLLPLAEETLEVLESFSSRFARYSDIAITKYLRFLCLEADPAFRGSPIDILNNAEKNGWIASASDWRRIRELRNLAAHEYQAEDILALYKELIRLTPVLLHLKV